MSRAFNRPAALVLLVAVVNVSLFGVFLGLRLAQPSDGARLLPGKQVYTASGVIVTPLVDEPGGLLPGDEVWAVDGYSIESWTGALLCWRPLCVPPDRPDWQIGEALTYSVVRDGDLQDVKVALRPYPLGANLRQDWGAMLYALALLATGAFVFARRPDETATRLLLLGGASMVGATTWSLGLQALDFTRPLMFWLHQVTTNGVYLLIWATILHFTLIFPNRHRLIARHGWLVPLIYVLPFAVLVAAVALSGLQATSTLDWLDRLGLDQSATVTVYLLLSLVALVTNYRQQTDSVSRQQIRVVVYAMGLISVLAILVWQLPQLVLGEQRFASSMMAIIGLLLPISLAVSIMRYRLWDIDVIVNRTAVYGLLTLVIVGLYIAVVGGLGAVFRQQGSLLFSLIATGLAAVAFQPLRERLQRMVNRIMYGERDDPYEVISHLGRQLQSAAVPEDLLETITHTVATALKLPYASVAILEGGQYVLQAEYGIPRTELFSLPLVYQGEVVGQLAVAQRGRGEPFTPPDVRLLRDIAQHTGVVVHSVRLNRDLWRSRERLVTAREEERRRLRRDLHDGLGPTLASHALWLDAIDELVDTDPAKAKRLIVELKNQTQETVAEIRRLVYELRPPALDELGLVEAVRAHILHLTASSPELDIRFEVPGGDLPPLSAAVEVAAYRIILESLTNVLRHADARTCRVRITASQNVNCALRVDVIDDGRGLPKSLQPGVGLISMRERAEELGGEWTIEEPASGGTRVTVLLPIVK